MMVDVPPAPNVHDLYTLLKSYPPRPPQIDHNLDQVILFQYTGGTTGVPKAAMLTHRNLVANVYQMSAWFAKAEYGKEKLLGALPFFHVYGMTVGMLLSFAIGAELIVVPDPRNIDHVLDVIQHDHVTLYPGVPTMYNAVINHKRVNEYDLHSIRACLSGGSGLPEEIARQFEKLTGGRLVEGYGLSETSPVATANPIFGEGRVGSVGLPLPNTDVAVFSLEPDENGDYARQPAGEEGELCISGPQVMVGYWNMPDETAITIDKNGWLHTGDIGKMDEDGFFYVVDRKKDLIIASGYNIVPREVEEVLFTHPKVMEVAVAGVPDARRGETVKAYVVLQPDQVCSEEEVRTFCKEHLAPYKVPTEVEFRTELPKSQVGKVLRRMLVEEELARQKDAPAQPEG
jgi:long-chain acyl-CoA synthetase